MSLIRVIAFILMGSTTAFAQEGVLFDEGSGNYIVTYKSYYSDKLKRVVFEPSTKISPSLRSAFVWLRQGNTISYSYALKNGKTAKQPIGLLTTDVSNVNAGGQIAPTGWESTVVPALEGSGLLLSWSPRLGGVDKLQGLAPGAAKTGFILKSNDLPGVATVKARGITDHVTEWLGHFPVGAVGERMEEIIQVDFVPVRAAIPRIPVPIPFDAGAVLANIRTHINTDMVSMQLIDPVFANELNRLFTAAIEAAKHNNERGVKEHLKDIRKQLKKAHKDVDNEPKDDGDSNWESMDPKQKPKPATIDRLAARVLDFDVKYVLGRLGKDEKD